MKKFCLWIALFIIFLTANISEAKTVKFVAMTLTELNSEDLATKYTTLKVLTETTLGDIQLEKDAMLRVKILNVKNARRAKLDAYIEGEILAYSKPSESNKMYDVSIDELSCKLKAYSPTDFKGLAQNAALSAAGHVLNVPLLTQGVAAVKGAAHPIEGQSRLKSAGISAFDSTPLSYAKKGEELNAEVGDLLTVSVKVYSLDTEDDETEQREEIIETKTKIKLQSSEEKTITRTEKTPKGSPIHTTTDPQPQDFSETDLEKFDE